ncbi:hypothetical protein BN1232_05656 [Mycobacterium lentiflavum]|uniref:Uncharacterized protein n=1 Tax=Mycobacterium lentiflavum TaxID=141349 RepID=A0A0E4H528_MYCLN|nr:hypothetical protein BN1232_05656 [Mycobacterium lentiflavum]
MSFTPSSTVGIAPVVYCRTGDRTDVVDGEPRHYGARHSFSEMFANSPLRHQNHRHKPRGN